MKYYIKEYQKSEESKKTAGGKARDDVNAILSGNGYECVEYVDDILESGSVMEALKFHRIKADKLASMLEGLKAGDELVVQFPIVNNSIYHSKTFKKLKKRGVKITLIIHDLESLRYIKGRDIPLKKRIRLYIEEKSILKIADRIIVHNDSMKESMAERGYDKGKMVSLGIFDYLIPGYDDLRGEAADGRDLNGPVIIAGNLKREKVGYVYSLPEKVPFRLYGIGYEEQDADNIEYLGSFSPDELPFALKGSFGLVWDGSSSKTCEGMYGQYLKINNPHKTSLYIAAALPVIIWSESALAGFIIENNCGIVVDSLHDIPGRLSKLSEEEYAQMVLDTEKLGARLRAGDFLLKALGE